MFKPNHLNNAKLCYIDTDNFIIHIKTEYFYKDVEKWFDTSNYDEDECNSINKRPLPIGKKQKSN